MDMDMDIANGWIYSDFVENNNEFDGQHNTLPNDWDYSESQSEEAQILFDEIKSKYWLLSQYKIVNEYITAIGYCGNLIEAGDINKSIILSKYLNENQKVKPDNKKCLKYLGDIYMRLTENLDQLSEKEMGVEVQNQIAKETLNSPIISKYY
jgi:hypothetical protein